MPAQVGGLERKHRFRQHADVDLIKKHLRRDSSIRIQKDGIKQRA